MVFYELSEGHREAVTEKLKSDIEQLRDDFAKPNIKPPDDMVDFLELLRNRDHSGDREVKAAEKRVFFKKKKHVFLRVLPGLYRECAAAQP